MKLKATSVVFFLLVLCAATCSWSVTEAFAQDQAPTQTNDDKLVYADFERVENGRVVSNNGGMIQIYEGHESTPVKFKGMANVSPGAPELVRAKGDDKNHFASFDYTLFGPNQWANVTLEIQGRPAKNGQPVPDDVTGYKNLSLQLFATGVDYIRVEFMSRGQGIKLDGGFPQLVIRLKPGLNTYLIPIKNLQQPAWQQERVSTKDVLKGLTAVTISAYCEQCTPKNGTVAVDNMVFQK
jgi:hypothetical protein